ncbi:hypothetical protein DEU56DRAFT_981257 [Suillus clintonianus]|uniref:uncharacterized protein n=1 Tax=Suillus clintonianus TaxID=1904413 RepID=UPI001B878E27|nr:uncharacterized protein DEU56DRAFT_981257 [Suillus clintonianus]KAG2134761.1 hypothetical protein DEU56DRAFT_981257 [Suillus clintonianus]
MFIKCAERGPCVIHGIDVMDNDGKFKTLCAQRLDDVAEEENKFWSKLHEKVENVRVRALFVDNLTVPVLKMLGTRFNIEPFFFSSSTNWIPSRYREEVRHGKGDHITVILPFIRTTEKPIHRVPSSSSSSGAKRKNSIDVLAPLHLHGEHVLLIDLMAVHMIRESNSSTIITYHPSLPGRTTAERLHQVMELAGGSVYWNKIFEASKDPTFFFLAILWYALYAWDEAFEVLYLRIKELEAILNESDFTRMADRNHSLHSLQAHLLHYQTLLHDFQISVEFVKDSPNPAMEPSDNQSTSKEFIDNQNTTKELMERECKNLLSEIDRLERKCLMFISRLKNATDLAFASINIEDSRQTQRLTEATLRDSAVMKQISYLTMVFLPASFTASVFGMNVVEMNPGSLETVARYVEVSFVLTFATTWVVIALQPYSTIHKSDAGIWRRAVWPAFFLSHIFMAYFRKTSSQGNNPCLHPIRRGRRSSTLRFDDEA